MRASTFEFRLRGLILTLIVVIGFWAPWLQALDMGRRVSLLESLALEISRVNLLRFSYAIPAVIITGALLSAVGMLLRIAGTAYLGYGIVHDGRMQSPELVIAGPYRYVRNPLYLGGWCLIVAISLLMPPSGAFVALPLVALYFLRLIFVEEAFLESRLGAIYRQYRRNVPRIIPRLRPNVPRRMARPQWLLAVSTELASIGTFLTFTVFAWTYDNLLMIKVILISFGTSLVVQALAMGKTEPVESNIDPT